MFMLLIMRPDKFKGSLGFSDKEELPGSATDTAGLIIHTMFLYKDLKDESLVTSSLYCP